jgi:hypothetical protein
MIERPTISHPLQFAKEKAPPEALPAPFGAGSIAPGEVGLSKVRYYNKQERPDLALLDEGFRKANTAQISPAGIVFYTKRPGRAKDPNQKFNEENLSPGCHTKGFSQSAARRVRAIAGEWAAMAQGNEQNGKGKTKFGFWTFTLPAAQGYREGPDGWDLENPVNSDQNIKRGVLNTLLQYVRRQGARYLWRAETQANGNLHFHVLVDKFLPFHELRIVYIEALAKHTTLCQGFADPVEQWKNGIDVEFVKDPDNIGGYMAKYFSKSDPEERRRPVQGKQWGASAALKLLKSPAINRECSAKGYQMICNAAIEAVEAGNYVKYGDYFTFVAVTPRELNYMAPAVGQFCRQYRGAYYAATFADVPDLWEIYRARRLADPALFVRPIPWEGFDKVNIYEFCQFHGLTNIGGVQLPRQKQNNEAQGRIQKFRSDVAIDRKADQGEPGLCRNLVAGRDRKPGRAVPPIKTLFDV